MINKETKIIKVLKSKGRISTSRIAFEIKFNHWQTEKYLEKLEEEGKIKKQEETNGTYWELNEENGKW